MKGLDKQEKWTPRTFTNQLMKKFKLYRDEFNRLWIYDNKEKLWVEDARNRIEYDLRSSMLSEGDIRKQRVEEIIADLKIMCQGQNPVKEPAWNLVPFKNMIFDAKTGNTFPYSHNYFFMSKLGVNYNQQAKCPKIDRIFKELVHPEQLNNLYELIAYCMIRSYPNQKVFFLYGSGGNGKSVFQSILTTVLGKQNVSAVSLHELQSDRFASSDLFNKYANISGELKYGTLDNTNILKKLSGNDIIRAQRKFQQSFDFVNHAKLIFATNELPKTIDRTDSFYRRILLIEFPNKFTGDKEDKDLLRKIPKKEYEGLAFKCASILKRLYKKRFTFTNEKTLSEVEAVYEDLTNPLETFIREFCLEDSSGAIPKQEFRDKLNSWLYEKRLRRLDDKEIKKEMKTLDFSDHRSSFGERHREWVGLKWKEEQETSSGSVQGVQDVQGLILKGKK